MSTPQAEHTRETRWQASELKFLVPPECAQQIKAWARQHLQADPHCNPEMGDGYRITSLYFDSPEFDLFHQRGSFARAKYRIRRYGSADSVFVERKLKNSFMIAKRRSAIGIEELCALDPGNPVDSGWSAYWFHRRLIARRFQPVCQIAYQRMARVLPAESGMVRLTIDHDVRALPITDIRFSQNKDSRLLLDHSFIVEMKYQQKLPVLFQNVIDEFRLTPQAVSKYRLAAASLDLAPPQLVTMNEPAQPCARC